MGAVEYDRTWRVWDDADYQGTFGCTHGGCCRGGSIAVIVNGDTHWRGDALCDEHLHLIEGGAS